MQLPLTVSVRGHIDSDVLSGLHWRFMESGQLYLGRCPSCGPHRSKRLQPIATCLQVQAILVQSQCEATAVALEFYISSQEMCIWLHQRARGVPKPKPCCSLAPTGQHKFLPSRPASSYHDAELTTA